MKEPPLAEGERGSTSEREIKEECAIEVAQKSQVFKTK
jgi:hypothetical protein